MSAVIGARGRTHPKTALREIQTVARRAPHPIMRHPTNVSLIDTTLIQQILHQASDWIVGKRGHVRGVQTEAPLQPARNVVLPATLAPFEVPPRRDPPVAGIEAQLRSV